MLPILLPIGVGIQIIVLITVSSSIRRLVNQFDEDGSDKNVRLARFPMEGRMVPWRFWSAKFLYGFMRES